MKRIITSPNAPAPVGPYNQAVIANGFLFVSGQIAIIPQTGQLVTSGVKDETIQVMENIKAILDEVKLTFESIVKVSIFATSMDFFPLVNEVYGSYFNHDTAPAREFVEVRGLPKGVQVEISVIAVIA
jgi:2-iminobutanoate/2-iminopropanoate deaminase